MATSTGLPRAFERVYGVAGGAVKLDAEVGLQGRTRATRRGGVLGRPVACSCARWRARGMVIMLGPGGVVLLLAKDRVWRV